MPSQLPPFSTLRVFECAARHASFTHAAEELSITQSAVSHQIRALEAWVGFPLFVRGGQRPVLTPGGRRYARTLSAAIGQMVLATQDLITTGSHQILNLRGYGMFFVQWLIPRLPNFESQHADIKIRLTANVEPVDFSRDTADIAIVYGAGNWNDCRSDLLFPDTLVPVASPRLLSTLPARPTLEKILTLPMLYSRRREQWEEWLAAAGIERKLSAVDMHFEDVTILYQCAIQGLGIALMQVKHVEQDILDGRVQLAWPFALRRQGGYHLVCPNDAVGTEKIERFRSWLLSQDLTAPDIASLIAASTKNRNLPR